MRKVWVIARREYLAMVGAKAFLISLALMPILMLGSLLVPNLLKNQVDLRPKRIALIDHSKQLAPLIEEAVDEYNKRGTRDPATGKQVRPAYELELIPSAGVTDETRWELSQRVRRGELRGFIEIPADILAPPGATRSMTIGFYAENAALLPAKSWFSATITSLVRQRRLQQAGIDPQIVAAANAVRVEGRGLFRRGEAGGVEAADRTQRIAAFLLPMGIMMFMFMLIMMSAQPMLESVLEEKTNRIAEVLLGSATPWQLMAGKLLGNVGGSLTVATIYIAGAYGVAHYQSMTDLLPLGILPWFIVFQILAVLMFSSLFLAIGASVNQLKEAQSLLMPVWIVIVMPMFVWLNVVRDPNSAFSTWLSLTPPFIPMLMCLRLAVSTSVSVWQPLVGVGLMLAVTGLSVFLAGRVFRIGMLMQGQSPRMAELIRWAVRG